MPENDKDNEIRITRWYDSPVAVVWRAFTDPDQAAHWWGPRGFTLTTHSKALRPGGIWHYTMHGPDGVDYPNKTLYHEVEENRRLVYDHGGNDERAPLFRVTVTFAEFDGGTAFDMTMKLPSAEEAAATRRFIKEAGGNATWDRLAEYLDKTERGVHSFVINRSFAAPVEQVFDMWADPVHLAEWLPPPGFTAEFPEADIRAGGRSFVRMSNTSGLTLHAIFEYREVERARRIAYLQRFCDDNGRSARHPLMPDFPEAMLTSASFTPEGGGAARVTLVSRLLDNATAEEIDAFTKARSGMTMGWSASFDQLEPLLERADAGAKIALK